jgi:hypothetical protein
VITNISEALVTFILRVRSLNPILNWGRGGKKKRKERERSLRCDMTLSWTDRLKL